MPDQTTVAVRYTFK